MDIFKVPTCCSCHVHGYAEIFPPHQKDPPAKPKESFPGADFATINDQKDDFQDLNKPVVLNHITKYTPSINFDSSHGILPQNHSPLPTLNETSANMSRFFQYPATRNQCWRSSTRRVDPALLCLVAELDRRSPRRSRGRTINCRNSMRPTREHRVTKDH